MINHDNIYKLNVIKEGKKEVEKLLENLNNIGRKKKKNKTLKKNKKITKKNKSRKNIILNNF